MTVFMEEVSGDESQRAAEKELSAVKEENTDETL